VKYGATRREKRGEGGNDVDSRDAGKPCASFTSLCALVALLFLGRERIVFRQTEAMEADNFGRTGNASQPRAA
jgi:hypothetical protein